MADSERVVSTVLDRLVPSFQAVERHSTTIAASSDQVWAALSQVTTGELRLFRVLMGVRVLPGRLLRSPRARFDADEPLLGWVVRFGFSILGEDVRRKLVFGAIAQPWRLAGGRGMAIADARTSRPSTSPAMPRWRPTSGLTHHNLLRKRVVAEGVLVPIDDRDLVEVVSRWRRYLAVVRS